MASDRLRGERPSWRFWAIVAFVALVALTGGSSRHDTASLMLLRPVAVAMVASGLLLITREAWLRVRWPLLLLGGLIALALVQLVPLPPGVWQALPYRAFIAKIDSVAGLGEVWRPLSIAPERTRNALFALLVPFAMLLWLAPVSRLEGRLLVPLAIGVGIVSGLLGLLQVGAGEGSALFLYRIVSVDAAVGLFANRNHQGVFLAMMLPMLAVFASTASATPGLRRLKHIGAVATAVILLLLILLSGSRAGLLMAVVGLLAMPFLYRSDGVQFAKRRKQDGGFPVTGVAIGLGGTALLVLGAVVFSRAASLDRLAAGADEDVRWNIWAPTLDIMQKYFPAGSGLGTFVEAYQRDEPLATLTPTYVNHAHNDWIELLLTGGLPAVLLVIAGLVWLIRASWRAWFGAGGIGSAGGGATGGHMHCARMASVLVLILAAASFVDYPLRTPLMAAFGAFVLFWLCPGLRKDRVQNERPVG